MGPEGAAAYHFLSVIRRRSKRCQKVPIPTLTVVPRFPIKLGKVMFCVSVTRPWMGLTWASTRSIATASFSDRKPEIDRRNYRKYLRGRFVPKDVRRHDSVLAGQRHLLAGCFMNHLGQAVDIPDQ